MARTCPTCNKGTIMGGHYSNRVRATKFNPTGLSRKYPNLQWSRLPDGKRIKICTKCIKKGNNTKAKVAKAK
ncbi:MAG: L28 family ribosomal protein [Candidatus Pacebacteria bacterium]|nr:L28 family ribosomal protein [Candidatus Paceibacterota bacterium]